MKSAIVVGAGFAGLSAAIELSRRGVAVTVLEAADRPGGRAQLWEQDGYRFDLGPTLIVMTDVLRRALGDEGFERLALRRIEPGYRVRWPGGDSLAIHSDVALLLQEFARYEPGRASRVLHYLAKVRQSYPEARSKILDVDHTYGSFARTLFSPGRVAPWVLGSLRKFTQKYFSHPRLIEALTFQTLYLGLSPLRAPAMYALLPTEEIVGGVWYTSGGTGTIVDAFVDTAMARGVRFIYGAKVDHIARASDGGIRVECGSSVYDAEGVVVAADREPSQHLFGDPLPRSRSPRYGHSAAVWYFGVDAPLELDHHTIFLPSDPFRSYAQLDAGRVPDETMLYLCNAAATDPSVAPPGGRTLLALTLVPNRRVLADFDEAALRDKVIAAIESMTGPFRERIVVERRRTPVEFESELGLMHGAAFGPDHTLDQMGPFRPAIAHARWPNVVFAGSGTRPGSGVPMVVISGRLAAERLAGA
jgi:phytoene desaturase